MKKFLLLGRYNLVHTGTSTLVTLRNNLYEALDLCFLNKDIQDMEYLIENVEAELAIRRIL